MLNKARGLLQKATERLIERERMKTIIVLLILVIPVACNQTHAQPQSDDLCREYEKNMEEVREFCFKSVSNCESIFHRQDSVGAPGSALGCYVGAALDCQRATNNRRVPDFAKKYLGIGKTNDDQH
jgi:hypothetical protein